MKFYSIPNRIPTRFDEPDVWMVASDEEVARLGSYMLDPRIVQEVMQIMVVRPGDLLPPEDQQSALNDFRTELNRVRSRLEGKEPEPRCNILVNQGPGGEFYRVTQERDRNAAQGETDVSPKR